MNIFFKPNGHRERFLFAVQGMWKLDAGKLDKDYGPALYLLTADEECWERARVYIGHGIDFASILKRLGHSGGEKFLIKWAWNLFNGGVRVDPQYMRNLSEQEYKLCAQALDLSYYDLRVEDLEDKKQHSTIIINANTFTISGGEITYEGVVKLALGERAREGVLYTVVYGRGVEGDPVGSLLPGGCVKVRDGTIFSVANTGNA